MKNRRMTGSPRKLSASTFNLSHELEPIRHVKISKTIVIPKTSQSVGNSQAKAHRRSENCLDDLTSEIESLLTEGK
jgi:hypothetical protein